MPATKPDAQAYRYESDHNVASYSCDHGLLVTPVMGPLGTPPKVLRMSAGVGYRTQNFGYRKRGSPPIYPAMQDTPSGDIFLGGELSVTVPDIGGDENQFDYVIAGAYEYVQAASAAGATFPGSFRASGDKFQSGRKPYQSNLLSARVLAAVGAVAGGAAAVAIGNPYSAAAKGWPSPTGKVSASASSIDVSDPKWEFYDTTIPGNHLSCSDLIL